MTPATWGWTARTPLRARVARQQLRHSGASTRRFTGVPVAGGAICRPLRRHGWEGRQPEVTIHNGCPLWGKDRPLSIRGPLAHDLGQAANRWLNPIICRKHRPNVANSARAPKGLNTEHLRPPAENKVAVCAPWLGKWTAGFAGEELEYEIGPGTVKRLRGGQNKP